MKLNPIGSNITEIEVGNKTVLFSYKTPVAYHEAGIGYAKPSKESVAMKKPKEKRKDKEFICDLCKQTYNDCPKNSYWHRWYRTDNDKQYGWFTGH